MSYDFDTVIKIHPGWLLDGNAKACDLAYQGKNNAGSALNRSGRPARWCGQVAGNARGLHGNFRNRNIFSVIPKKMSRFAGAVEIRAAGYEKILTAGNCQVLVNQRVGRVGCIHLDP